jgi:cytochrome c oxidase subunit 2
VTPFPGLPPDGSAHGADIDRLLLILHVFMAIVFAVWFVYFIVTLVRFRMSRNPAAAYRGPRGVLIAATVVVVLVVEIVLDVFFSVPIWSKRSKEFPDPKDATVVRIVAEQFSWNVHYPGRDGVFGRTSADLVGPFNPLGLDRDDPAAKDDITLINQMTVPAGKPVIAYLTSKDVIHSLNIPVYRIKQDAVPGLMSPVWFIPEKTTAQIRDEMATDFSVAKAVSTGRTITLPSVETLDLAGGSAPGGYIAAAEVHDTSGQALISAGDGLADGNVRALLSAGVTTLRSRRKANLENYISTRAYSDRGGNAVIAAHQTLTEDAVTALLDAGISQVEARKTSRTDPWIIRSALTAPDGSEIAAVGAPLDEEIISKAAAAGIGTLAVAPATPTEIACAQLCGLGHYQMKATLDVLEPGEFEKWFNAREAELAGSDASTAAETPKDSTGQQGRKE